MRKFTKYPKSIGASKTIMSSTEDPNWKNIVKGLEDDLEEGIDPLYDDSDAGDELYNYMNDVVDALNLYIEPSVQGGRGGIWIYDDDSGKILAENIDFEDFNSTVVDMALKSNNSGEFKQQFKSYLEDLLSDPAYAPEEDEDE